MEFAFTQEQEELRREARSFLEANPDAPLADAARARLARRLRPRGARRRRALVRRRGDPVRGGRPRALLRAVPDDRGRPARPARGRRAGLVGRARRARPPPRHGRPGAARGHDHRPAEGETLATVDETRPLGRLARATGDTGSTATSSPCGCGCSPRSRSRRSASRRRRSSSASSTSPTREQFGKKIGTYQAVSHPLADTYVETELARSLAYWAAWCVAEDDEQAPVAVAAAKAQRPRPPSPPASARSRCTAASASPGSTSCTATTSARSGSTRSAATPPSSARSSPPRCSTRKETHARPER